MVDAIGRKYRLFPTDEVKEGFGRSQSRRKRLLRNHVFPNAPLYFRSVGYFFYRYVLRLGFLDGREGLVYHSLQAYCFFLLIDAKIAEARRLIDTHGVEAFRDYLAQRYGIAAPTADGDSVADPQRGVRIDKVPSIAAA
jgi:hypothetical protein